ncbi:MAG TPA: hypothetical protein ENG51_10090 [Deltaproteobacteria bacterium]|nr:hypothetical protein [Candidatus Aminicenantes bacterium]RLA95506.1 MAG: hypothetical protein DRG25_00025 [Deltaproteobacteria bacterium]HDM76805.1 hypothetical protein [Deltaproteobacteria bacterium]
MKMVFIVYNSALEGEVAECLTRCKVESYTKFPILHGKGQLSDPHMGTHIWPATNAALLIACEDEKVKQILEEVKKIKKTFKKEGIKAFVTALEWMV